MMISSCDIYGSVASGKQHSLIQRLGVSWRSHFSPRSRYEIASVIAILGLILVLFAFAGGCLICSTGSLNAKFLYACAQMAISPVALVIFTLCIGAISLLFGIYLLPYSSSPSVHLLP